MTKVFRLGRLKMTERGSGHQICRLSFVVCRLSFVVCRLSFVVCRLSVYYKSLKKMNENNNLWSN